MKLLAVAHEESAACEGISLVGPSKHVQEQCLCHAEADAEKEKAAPWHRRHFVAGGALRRPEAPLTTWVL